MTEACVMCNDLIERIGHASPPAQARRGKFPLGISAAKEVREGRGKKGCNLRSGACQTLTRVPSLLSHQYLTRRTPKALVMSKKANRPSSALSGSMQNDEVILCLFIEGNRAPSI